MEICVNRSFEKELQRILNRIEFLYLIFYIGKDLENKEIEKNNKFFTNNYDYLKILLSMKRQYYYTE